MSGFDTHDWCMHLESLGFVPPTTMPTRFVIERRQSPPPKAAHDIEQYPQRLASPVMLQEACRVCDPESDCATATKLYMAEARPSGEPANAV